MPTKISEKKLILSIICVAMGLIILFKTSLITTPLYVSEKGILFTIFAIILVALGLKALSGSQKTA